MSMVAVYLPFILLVLLALVLLAVYYMRKSLSVKITHWLLLIYSSVLLGATVMVLFGADIEKISFSPANEAEEMETMEAGSEFSEAIENGTRPVVDSKYIKEEKSFVVDSSVVTIDSNWEHPPYVFIERIGNDHESMKAIVYSFSSYIADGYDLTQMVTPPSVKQTKNKLLISGPGFKENNLFVATQEFPIVQFEEDRKSFDNIRTSSSREQYVIYLQIPEGVEIKETENVNIDYLQ